MTQQAQHRQCREKSCRQVMLVAVVAVVRQAVGICQCAGQMPAVCRRHIGGHIFECRMRLG
jgi:hypothetical protein